MSSRWGHFPYAPPSQTLGSAVKRKAAVYFAGNEAVNKANYLGRRL